MIRTRKLLQILPLSAGDSKRYAEDPFWRDLVLFYEFFDGDSGRGCGASHQTGWTALVVNCLMMKLGMRHAGLAWRYDPAQ